MKKLILGIAGILAISIVIFSLQSAPIDPAAYDPPKSNALAGVLAQNNALQKAELLAKGKISGPEEVAIDSQGRVYAGMQDGKIMCLLPDGRLETFADTKGRPLGIQFTDALDISSDGTIYFTDASFKYGQNEYLYDLLESKPHGRLLSFDPATGQISL